MLPTSVYVLHLSDLLIGGSSALENTVGGVEDEDQDDPSERVCLQLILPRLLFDDITVLGGSDYCFTRIYLIGISILTLLFADTNPNFNSLRKRK